MRISFQGLMQQDVGPFVGETCCWNMSGHMQGEGEKASDQKIELMLSISALSQAMVSESLISC